MREHSSPTTHEIFAIGDVHGCLTQLVNLVEICRQLDRDGVRTFVFLGDYVDRGPASKGVVDFLIDLQRNDSRTICLRGNHEQMLMDVSQPDRSDRDLMTWFGNGGEATLQAYGVDDPMDLPPEHLAWMRELPLIHEDSFRFFVHAGIRPGVPLDAQNPHDLLWIREPFLISTEPHASYVVHGHSPTANRLPDLRANRLNLDVGACFGGRLTAAAFVSDQRFPTDFITCDGKVTALSRPKV